jgi:hypothetical protein
MVRRAWHNYRADNAILPDPALDDPAETEARALAGKRIADTRSGEWRSLGVQLGIDYAASPLIVADGTPAPENDPDSYILSARPGRRAPHAWLADGQSVLDLVRGRFTLLHFETAADSDPLAHAFRDRGIPLDLAWAGAAGVRELYGCALALIRPDGIVAWRGENAPDDPAALVDQVTGRTGQSHAARADR